MEGYIVFNMDNGERTHNNFEELNRAHCRHGISIPGSNCLFSRIKFIQYCRIIYNYGQLRDTDRLNFFKHYHYKRYCKLDGRVRRRDL